MQKRRLLLVLCILGLCFSGQTRGGPCGAVIADGTLPKNPGGKNWYFYVPAGTTNVHYFPGTDNCTHEVRGPNNEYIATVTEDGEIKTVAVPPGLDGRMWTLTFPYQPRTIWSYNCPNWISASKNALLVPRDVAISDGLDIR